MNSKTIARAGFTRKAFHIEKREPEQIAKAKEGGSMTPEQIKEAIAEGENCLRMNGYDFPPELNAIGREDEIREVVRPWSGKCDPKLNAWVSRYRWTSKRLRGDNRVLDYCCGGWTWLGGRAVGTWLLVYCGAETRNEVSA